MIVKLKEEAKEKQEKLVKTATCDTSVPGNRLEPAMERTTAQASWTNIDCSLYLHILWIIGNFYRNN